MSLAHESTIIFPGSKAGDMKIAHYSISYTAGAVVKPTNDPTWMLLNGASVATATYPLLFALFGYSYGGSGANFTLPNLTEGKLPIGRGLTNFTSLASTGGEINHGLVTTEIASHAHSDTLAFAASAHGHTSSAGMTSDDSHTHTMTNALSAGDLVVTIGTAPFTVNNDLGSTGDTTSSATSTHGHSGSLVVDANTSGISGSGSVSSAGSGTAHNNMQPYIVIGGWLVKFG